MNVSRTSKECVGTCRQDWLRMYRNMVVSRCLDEAMVREFHAGPPPRGVAPHTDVGQEAVAAGACAVLRRDDYVVKTHRGFGPDIARGTPLNRLMAEMRGKATGLCKGKGSLHVAYVEGGLVGIGGTVGSVFPLAAGLAFAAQQEGRGRIVACFFGDGAAQRGTLHEAMNWVSVRKLPVVWICENNQYYVTIPVHEAVAAKNIVDLAGSYNMAGQIVDGQDVLAVAEAVHAAAERARKGAGPTLLECKTYRFRGHEEVVGQQHWGGPEDPRGADASLWRARDPITLFREYLLGKGVTAAELEAMDQAADAEVEEAFRFAADSSYPESSDAYQDLYAD